MKKFFLILSLFLGACCERHDHVRFIEGCTPGYPSQCNIYQNGQPMVIIQNEYGRIIERRHWR